MPAAVAVTTQPPTPTIISAPLDASTVHTVSGAAEYDSAVRAPLGAVTVGAADPNVTEAALYSNPVSAWSPLATAGNVMSTVSVLPAVSDAVTVAVAVPAPAASGVPLIAPLPVSMPSPDGSPAAPYPSMPMPPLALISVIATPTFSDTGAA